jgi:hypothetical protein
MVTIVRHLPQKHTIGMDIGQAQDPTAICLLRREPVEEGPDKHVAVYCHRAPLRTPYDELSRAGSGPSCSCGRRPKTRASRCPR